MAGCYQIFVEGQSDAIILRRLIADMCQVDWSTSWEVLRKNGLWKMKYTDDLIYIRNLRGFENLNNIAAEADIIKDVKEQKVTKNLVVFDADVPSTGGGVQERKAYIRSIIERNGFLLSKFSIFLMPDDVNDGYLETLLLGAKMPNLSRVQNCFMAFEQCVQKNSAPFALSDKNRVSLYAWLFDSNASKTLRVDDALAGSAVIDIKSSVFDNLRNFLHAEIPCL